MLLFQFAPERSRVLQGTAAEAELGGDWRGNRSGGCGRNPWGADGGESGAGIHRATASSASAHYVSGVAPTKGHLAVVERNQSVVGDGYAVGITAEVVEHILTTLTYDRNSIGFQDHKGKALPSGRALC